jgi:hypothetical protein
MAFTCVPDFSGRCAPGYRSGPWATRDRLDLVTDDVPAGGAGDPRRPDRLPPGPTVNR